MKIRWPFVYLLILLFTIFIGIGFSNNTPHEDWETINDKDIFYMYGNVGVGLLYPNVSLSVSGSISTSRLIFSDGTSMTTAALSGSSSVTITGTIPISAVANNISLNYNTTNLKITANQLNTSQDISNSSIPTFGGLNVNGAVTATTLTGTSIISASAVYSGGYQTLTTNSTATTANYALNAGLLDGLDSLAFLKVSNDLSDLNSVSVARSNLGLGTMALQNSSAVSLTGGNFSTSGWVTATGFSGDGSNLTNLSASSVASGNFFRKDISDTVPSPNLATFSGGISGSEMTLSGGITAGTSFSVGTSFTVSENGNVGIGTVNATAQLDIRPKDVFGTGSFLSFGHIVSNSLTGFDLNRVTISSANTGTSEIYLRSSNSNANAFGLISSKPIYIHPLSVANSISLGRGNINTSPGQVNQSTTDIFIQGTTGYVGFRTRTPTEILYVSGNAKITGTLSVAGNTAITGTLFTNDVISGTALNASTSISAATMTATNYVSAPNMNATGVTASGTITGSIITGSNYISSPTVYSGGLATLNTNSTATTATNATLLNNQAGSYYLARANHTGTQLASTISDSGTWLRTDIADEATGLITFTGGISSTSVLSNSISGTTITLSNYVSAPTHFGKLSGTVLTSAGANFTSGSILYSDGVDIAQNPTQLFWDPSTKMLGVGTSSPGEKVDIVGNIEVNGNIQVTGIIQADNTSTNSIDSTTGAQVKMISRQDILMDVDSNGDENFRFFQVTHDGGKELFRIDESGLASGTNLSLSGNASITGTLTQNGAISANSTLVISGASTFSSQLAVNSNISATGNVSANRYLGDGSLLTGIVASSFNGGSVANFSTFNSGISTTFFNSTTSISGVLITASGRISGVGIWSSGDITGTSITANARISAATGIVSSDNITATNRIATSGMMKVGSETYNPGDGTTIAAGLIFGTVGSGIAAHTGSTTARNLMNFNNGINFGVASAAMPAMDFNCGTAAGCTYTFRTNSVNRYKIDTAGNSTINGNTSITGTLTASGLISGVGLWSSGDITGTNGNFSGNVVIGSATTPVAPYKLDINGTSDTPNLILATSNRNQTASIAISNPNAGSGGGAALVLDAGGGDAWVRYRADVGATTYWSAGLDNSDSDKWKISKSFVLGTSDYFVLDTSGNIGLAGITAPASVLDIKGTSGSFSISTTGNANISGTVYATNFSGDGSKLTNVPSGSFSGGDVTGYTTFSAGLSSTFIRISGGITGTTLAMSGAASIAGKTSFSGVISSTQSAQVDKLIVDPSAALPMYIGDIGSNYTGIGWTNPMNTTNYVLTSDTLQTYLNHSNAIVFRIANSSAMYISPTKQIGMGASPSTIDGTATLELDGVGAGNGGVLAFSHSTNSTPTIYAIPGEEEESLGNDLMIAASSSNASGTHLPGGTLLLYGGQANSDIIFGGGPAQGGNVLLVGGGGAGGAGDGFVEARTQFSASRGISITGSFTVSATDPAKHIPYFMGPIMMRDSAGACWKVSVSTLGVITTASATCQTTP